ncbi:MAG: NUDIX hydrolase [Micrococcales bacterium]|nr:NUDIX hydrolase [Micrococcales bacterium]
MNTITAAGTVPWRRRRGSLEVALVHRPRYDDWAWAKGKLEPGEEWVVAAVRETLEETGLEVQCGLPLPTSRYQLTKGSGVHDKEVRYWAAEVVGGSGELLHEIDEVAWLPVAGAASRLDYAHDRDQLEQLRQADEAGLLTTWPLVIVRHAKAVPRSAWKGDDWLRPLDDQGVERSQALAPVLAAYGVRRLVTSPSTRCAQTLEPYAATSGLRLRARRGLSEEGYAAAPSKPYKHLWRSLERGIPTALCTHGPVLPALTSQLVDLVETASPLGRNAIDELEDATDLDMDKGEALVCHVLGTGEAARVVAVERHRP